MYLERETTWSAGIDPGKYEQEQGGVRWVYFATGLNAAGAKL